MAVLEPDSLLLRQDTLSGIHEDAVRCIYDERLNRLKYLQDKPEEQLSEFRSVTDNAYVFWVSVSKLPEDRVGRKQKVKMKLSGFFDRVIRYADFHDDSNLTPTQSELKDTVIQNARDKKDALNL